MYALNADKAVSTIRSGIKKSCLFMGSGLIEAINCIMVSLYRKRTVKYMMQSMSRVAHCIDNGLMEGRNLGVVTPMEKYRMAFAA